VCGKPIRCGEPCITATYSRDRVGKCRHPECKGTGYRKDLYYAWDLIYYHDTACYWRQLRARRKAARAANICESCGERFRPTRSDALYCSGACRARAHRIAHAE
jgi:hypothetical protein